MTRIALLSTSRHRSADSAGPVAPDYVLANPARASHTEMGAVFEGADLVLARILGSPRDLCSGFARIKGDRRADGGPRRRADARRRADGAVERSHRGMR